VGHRSKANTESCLVRRNNGTERSGAGRVLLSLVSALTITTNCRGIRGKPAVFTPHYPKTREFSDTAESQSVARDDSLLGWGGRGKSIFNRMLWRER